MHTTTETAEVPALSVNVRTRKRTDTSFDIIARYGGDDEILLGTIRKAMYTGSYPWMGDLGTLSEPDVVRASSKWELVFEVCRLRGHAFFGNHVHYKYGSRTYVRHIKGHF